MPGFKQMFLALSITINQLLSPGKMTAQITLPSGLVSWIYCVAPDGKSTSIELCITANMYGKYDFSWLFI
jgi:hypothetical protein